MTLGLMAKDCEIRIDYDKLRKDRERKTNEQMKKDGIATQGWVEDPGVHHPFQAQ